VIKPTTNACRKRVDGFFICSVQKIMTIVFSFDFGRIDLERGKIHAPSIRVDSHDRVETRQLWESI